MPDRKPAPAPESLRAPDDFLNLAVGDAPDNAAEFTEPMRYQDSLLEFSGETLRRVLNSAHRQGLPMRVYISAPALLATVAPEALEPYMFYGDSITVDPVKRRIYKDGNLVEMQRREFLLAAYLGRTPGIPHSRVDLMRDVWGNPNPSVLEMKNVPVYVTRVRKLLGAGAIITRRHVGYAAAE